MTSVIVAIFTIFLICFSTISEKKTKSLQFKLILNLIKGGDSKIILKLKLSALKRTLISLN